jgi:hypothetical protein
VRRGNHRSGYWRGLQQGRGDLPSVGAVAYIKDSCNSIAEEATNGKAPERKVPVI